MMTVTPLLPPESDSESEGSDSDSNSDSSSDGVFDCSTSSAPTETFDVDDVSWVFDFVSHATDATVTYDSDHE